MTASPTVRSALADHLPAPSSTEAQTKADVRVAEWLNIACIVLRGNADDGSLLRTLYLDLADFTAVYMGHLRDEEDRVMPALNAALGNDELCAVTAAIRGSVAPDAMCTYIRYMLPSMNFAERLEMLSGMHAGAPPQVFEMFRKAAQATLSAQQYGAVAAAAGFA